MTAATCRLDEVCDIVMGQAPPGDSYNDRGEGLPLIAGAGDFVDGLPQPKKFTTAATKVSVPGDIVLSIRASIGAKVLADDRYCLGRGVAGLRPSRSLHTRYLWHWLTGAAPELAAKGRGATFLQVNRGDIGEMKIPTPPLDEQRRLAVILDQGQTLRTKRRQVLARLDDLSRSIFLDMFGVPELNPHNLPQRALGSVATVVTGNTPSRAAPGNFGGELEWIKSDNLGSVLASPARERLSPAGRSAARLAPPGSILVTCIAGSPNSIGKASLVDREVAFNQQINAILPGPEILARFVLEQLRVSPGLVRAKSTGGMKGLVNKSAFSEIEILVPSLERQREFEARVATVGAYMQRGVQSESEISRLFDSLSARAFSGRL